MSTHSVEKKHLSAKGMLEKVYSIFKQIPDPPKDPRGAILEIPLIDCLMSALALFGLKFVSLLQFEDSYEDEIVQYQPQSSLSCCKSARRYNNTAAARPC